MSSTGKVDGSRTDKATPWADVVQYLEDPKNRQRVSPATAERLLELHYQLDGFDLPDRVVRLAAAHIGIDPAQAKSRFHRQASPTPLEAQDFRQLGRMLVDDLLSAVQDLPMGPVRAFTDILKETKAVFDRSRQAHLSKADRKQVRAHFDRLHAELRRGMAEAQTALADDELARASLLSDDTGAPVSTETLDARGQLALQKIDRRIEAHRDGLRELGNVGLAMTTLRGESFWEQNWLVLNAGVDVNAFMPVASVGVGGVREISVRDPRTGKAEVKDSASAVGLVTNGFTRKVVSAEDLKRGKWKDIFSTKGSGAGFSPIPFVNVLRDPIVGDAIGVFVPGLLFAELNSRPDGKAGFGGGFVFHIPGLPVGPVVSANWNHPVFKPLISRTIAPLSQFFGYLIRTFQLGVAEPVGQAAQHVKALVGPSPKESVDPDPDPLAAASKPGAITADR